METGVFGGAIIKRNGAIAAGVPGILLTAVQPGHVAVKLTVQRVIFSLVFRRPA